MPQRDQLVWQVEEVPYDDIQENSQIVGIEIFVCSWCCEDKVEKLENEQLEGGFCFAVEKKNYVLSESHV